MSGIGFGDRRSRPYHKRRPLPALIVIAVLCLGALIVWVYAMTTRGGIDDAIRCEPAASPPPGTTYTALGHGAIDDATPSPPDKIAVKVLNAGGARGRGASTTESLRTLGFSQIAPPENDPAYPADQNREANCRGQIRFGENGISSARTLSLLEPCLELIKDTRQDATADLSVGSNFTDVRPTQEATQVLEQLKGWSSQQQGGGEQSAGAAVPKIDQSLLAAARDVAC